MLVPAIVEVLAGLLLLWLAIRMRQGRVLRGSAAGVRTPSTMRSDAAFEVANKAAAPLTGAGGAILAVCGVLAAALPKHLAGVFIFGGAGVCLVLCLVGAMAGVRASRPAQLASPSSSVTSRIVIPARHRPSTGFTISRMLRPDCR
jgi:hypothetical protein